MVGSQFLRRKTCFVLGGSLRTSWKRTLPIMKMIPKKRNSRISQLAASIPQWIGILRGKSTGKSGFYPKQIRFSDLTAAVPVTHSGVDCLEAWDHGLLDVQRSEITLALNMGKRNFPRSNICHCCRCGHSGSKGVALIDKTLVSLPKFQPTNGRVAKGIDQFARSVCSTSDVSLDGPIQTIALQSVAQLMFV